MNVISRCSYEEEVVWFKNLCLVLQEMWFYWHLQTMTFSGPGSVCVKCEVAEMRVIAISEAMVLNRKKMECSFQVINESLAQV